MREDELAAFRGRTMGIVFQSFHLIPSLTALENVSVAMEIAGRKDAMKRAKALLADVGLAKREGHYPSQLSGGEQQRVAIARAIANDPPILLADEPTGNLDSSTGGQIVDLLTEINEQRGTTLLLVTHETSLAQRAGRTISLADGSVVRDETRRHEIESEAPVAAESR
jgi:putative ABC transport system ATP-binding protein